MVEDKSKSSEKVAQNEKAGNNNDPEEFQIIPPDGGYGWIIVAGSFICNMIFDGIGFSVGMMLPSIKDEFNTKESAVNTISSVQACSTLMLGPFVSALSNKYGFRLVSMAGGIMAAFGLGISYFATGVEFLCITYGFIGGMGFAMIYLPSIVIVGFYFERWRALATSIAVCGSGVGSFTMVPLTEYMVGTYGWRIAAVMHGSLCLLCFFICMLYKPPPRIPLNSKENIIKTNNALSQSNEKNVLVNSTDNFVKDKLAKTNDLINDRRLSLQTKSTGRKEKHEESAAPLLGSKAKLQGSLSTSLRKKSLYSSEASLVYHLSVAHLSSDLIKRNSTSDETKKPKGIALKVYIDLFKSPTFLLLALSGLFYMCAMLVPYTYTVKRARLIGGVQNTIWFIPLIGVTNTINRFVCGYVSSLENVSALWVNNICIIISAISLVLSGLSYQTYYQVIYCITLGFGFAAFPTLRSILTAEYMGMEKLTNSFGLLLLFQSIGALVGTPIAGALIDITGDFNASFYLAGGFLLLSALLHLPLNVVSKWEQGRTANQTEKVDA